MWVCCERIINCHHLFGVLVTTTFLVLLAAPARTWIVPPNLYRALGWVLFFAGRVLCHYCLVSSLKPAGGRMIGQDVILPPVFPVLYELHLEGLSHNFVEKHDGSFVVVDLNTPVFFT